MLSIVMLRALAVLAFQQYINDHCKRLPEFQVVLAHAAYGSFGRHTVDSVGVVVDLQYIWCDTSASC